MFLLFQTQTKRQQQQFALIIAGNLRLFNFTVGAGSSGVLQVLSSAEKILSDVKRKVYL